MTVARVTLPVAAPQPFDYWAPDGLALTRGSVVHVRLGPRRVHGVVIALDAQSELAPERMRPIEAVADVTPLPDDVLELCRFVAGYYQAAPGLVHALALPPLAVRATRRRGRDESAPGAGSAQHARNAAQRAAAQAIAAAGGGYAPFLLRGVTGSGKTEVYLDAAARAIATGGQVLMLVPEINLTPHLIARVHASLPGVNAVALHSGLADGMRRRHWDAAARGEAELVLGTRLAVFTPMPRLSLIVVDEEHDASYKQQDGVRYNARDVAVFRAHQRGVPVVLGSATPSLETYANARDGRYRRIDLAQRADPRARMPRIVLAPDREARARDGIGPVLAIAIEAALGRGEQALVFVNRRGYAPSLKCAACGWEAGCTRCSARLVLHRQPAQLQCHHCGHHERVPQACPNCGNVDLLPLGFGTQRLERALREAFPGVRIARIDRDTTRARGSFESVRARMAERTLDILIGTQMLAKGHDFPRLTTVGVLGADNALYSADFRATERLCALLMQVAGRAGRAEHPGEVVVQTDFPAHPVYDALRSHDYERFADQLLGERRAAELPPFAHVALLVAEAHERAHVDRFLSTAHALARRTMRDESTEVDVFPPVPALMPRRAGYERAQMLVQAARRGELQRFVQAWNRALLDVPGRRVRWALDVDPAGF
ncbi:MAG TPA: primosomal protein N' [Casimicrobiaceae bacterium]|jgi:primosomal protein N' (replication factor Y)